MSETAKQKGRESGKRRWLRWLAKVFAVAAVVICVGGSVAWYLVRTPVVLAKIAGPTIQEQAERADVDLSIGALGGRGLTGIRVYDMEASVAEQAGSAAIKAEVIDVYFDVGASFLRRRPVIGQIEIDELEMAVDRGSDRRREDSPRTDATDSPGDDPGQRDRFERWLTDEVDVAINTLRVDSSDFGAGVRFGDVRAVVDIGNRRLVELDANSDIAGVEFGVGADGESIFAEFGDSELDALLAELPMAVDIDRLSVDQDSIDEVVDRRSLRNLVVNLYGLVAESRAEPSMTIRIEQSHLSAGEGTVDWTAPLATVDGDEYSYRWTEPRLTYRQDAPGFSFVTDVQDGRGGRAELEGQWHLPTSLVAVNAWVHDFHWNGTIPGLSTDRVPVESVTVDGTFHGDIDLIHRLVSIDGQARLDDLTVDAPFVAGEPMTFDDVEVGLPLTVDTRSGAISVVGGTVSFGAVNPFELQGRIVDAGSDSFVFDVAATGQDIDAAMLVDRLPSQLTGVVAQTQLEGAFGVGVRASGHSAFPESLMLEVDLSGHVDVAQDLRWGEVEAADRGEVMFFDSASSSPPTVQGEWTALDDLPPHISATVLAAEDTAFFEHQGVDWRGLEMAMEDNLEEGRLARGGSTITQQVAKNLFLTHQRTLARKLQEAFLTWRIEETSTKEEILELYLNVVEWGPEVHGVFAASHYFFDRRPEQLQPLEMVMLASILPNPIQFGGAIRQGYLPSSREDKMRRVLENLRFLEELEFAEYFAAIEQLDEGQIGTLGFEICADDETAPVDARTCDDIELEARDGEEMTFETWEVAKSIDDTGWTPMTD